MGNRLYSNYYSIVLNLFQNFISNADWHPTPPPSYNAKNGIHEKLRILALFSTISGDDGTCSSNSPFLAARSLTMSISSIILPIEALRTSKRTVDRNFSGPTLISSWVKRASMMSAIVFWGAGLCHGSWLLRGVCFPKGTSAVWAFQSFPGRRPWQRGHIRSSTGAAPSDRHFHHPSPDRFG